MGAGPGQDWGATGPRGHVVPRRSALGAGRDPSGKLSDVAAAPSPAEAKSAWRPKGASSGALQAFPKPPIHGQRRSRRVDLTSYSVLKCRCFPLANVDGPPHRQQLLESIARLDRRARVLAAVVRLLLRVLRREPARYHAWRHASAACALDDRASCPRTTHAFVAYFNPSDKMPRLATRDGSCWQTTQLGTTTAESMAMDTDTMGRPWVAWLG
jgi:hypothetical protein